MKRKTKKPAAKKLSLKKPRKEKPTLVNFKLNRKDLKALTARAKRYANGNISLWLRHAGLNHVPRRKDLSP